LIGTCGFNAVVVQRGRRGEIAYDLSRAHWGRGVMAEVLPRMVAFGFEALALRRLEAMVTPGNARSCDLLERHGFQREGVLRDYALWKGAYCDQIVYGRVNDAVD
ncbi:N-acetyltransferase, partial [Maribellus luteus]